MKAKWFLRGLGVGIVIASLFLCISYRNDNDNSNVIKQAKELGMDFPTEETSSAEQIAEQLAADKKQNTVTPSAVSGSVVKGESEKDKKAKDKLNASEDDVSNASAYHKSTNSFVVRTGLLSSSVARELEEAGIIKSADKFDEYLEKNGYGKQVRSGKYEIPKNADFDTIAKIITRQN